MHLGSNINKNVRYQLGVVAVNYPASVGRVYTLQRIKRRNLKMANFVVLNSNELNNVNGGISRLDFITLFNPKYAYPDVRVVPVMGPGLYYAK